MKKIILLSMIFSIASCNLDNQSEIQDDPTLFYELSKNDLKNKIKGAWVGQTIGVTYGYPV